MNQKRLKNLNPAGRFGRFKMKGLVIIAFVFIGTSLSAQVRFGVTAGVSSSTLKSSSIIVDKDNNGTADYEFSSLSNAKVGLHGGLFSEIILWRYYIMPEVLLSTTGGEIQIRDLVSGQTKILDQRFTKLDIPVMVGRKFGPLRLGLGPIASMILSKPSDVLDFSGSSVVRRFNSATFGYQLDFGLDLGGFVLDIKREGNLSKLGTGVVIGGQQRSFDTRNSQWLLSLGLFF